MPMLIVISIMEEGVHLILNMMLNIVILHLKMYEMKILFSLTNNSQQQKDEDNMTVICCFTN